MRVCAPSRATSRTFSGGEFTSSTTSSRSAPCSRGPSCRQGRTRSVPCPRCRRRSPRFLAVLDQEAGVHPPVNFPLLAAALVPQPAREPPARPVHEADQGARGPAEQIDRPRHPQSDALALLERGDLRHLLAEDDVHIGDEHERDEDGDDPRPLRGQAREHGVNDAVDRRLADEAEREAGHSDAGWQAATLRLRSAIAVAVTSRRPGPDSPAPPRGCGAGRRARTRRRRKSR